MKLTNLAAIGRPIATRYLLICIDCDRSIPTPDRKPRVPLCRNCADARAQQRDADARARRERAEAGAR